MLGSWKAGAVWQINMIWGNDYNNNPVQVNTDQREANLTGVYLKQLLVYSTKDWANMLHCDNGKPCREGIKLGGIDL